MANRRMISSSTWKDEFIGELNFFQRCLWIGLFSSCADDQGRLLDNPILIRAELFPYDDIPITDIETGLLLFEQEKKITRYEFKGKKYIQILRWWENQKPQWASRSKYPPPDGWTDHIRTRENNLYITENWESRVDDLDYSPDCSPEQFSRDVRAGRQYPVPVPVPVPVPDPIPVTEINSQTPNFYSEFQQILSIPLAGQKDIDYLGDLVKEHGEEKILEIAKWLKNKDPDCKSMYKVLRSIDTASKKWIPGGKESGNEFDRILAEMKLEEAEHG